MPWPERLANLEFENQLFHATDGDWYFQNLTTMLLSDDCDIVNEVPESKLDASRKYQCYMPDITSCNISGHWAVYESNIEVACHSFSQIYFQPSNSIYDSYTIYRNEFCWLCNNKHKTDDVPTLCPSLEKDSLRSPFPSFSALIDFKRLEGTPNEDSMVNGRQCAKEEIFDKYFMRCRKLECPGGSLSVDGACKQVVYYIVHRSGLAIMFRVNIKLNWSVIANSEVASLVSEKVTEELEARLGLHTCGNCSVEVLHSPNAIGNNELRVLFVNIPTPSCQLDLIYKAVLTVSGKKIELELSSGISFTAYVRIAKRSHYDPRLNTDYKIIFQRDDNFCNQKYRVLIIEPLCPALKLAFSESLKLKDGKQRQKFLTFFQHGEPLNETTTVYVCIEDYVAVMSSATRKLFESTAIFFICVNCLSILSNNKMKNI